MIAVHKQPAVPQSVIVDHLIDALRCAKANDDIFLCYLIEMALTHAGKEEVPEEQFERSVA